uniref:Uncharacterized protein n=1 Tax=Hyaloperonospora arabidopsidis (strain Emoy2) TaxID=559515 RepID=M4BRQ1_HYAAE
MTNSANPVRAMLIRARAQTLILAYSGLTSKTWFRTAGSPLACLPHRAHVWEIVRRRIRPICLPPTY